MSIAMMTDDQITELMNQINDEWQLAYQICLEANTCANDERVDICLDMCADYLVTED